MYAQNRLVVVNTIASTFSDGLGIWNQLRNEFIAIWTNFANFDYFQKLAKSKKKSIVIFFVPESEVGGRRLQKSQIPTSRWSLMYVISFGGVDFVISVISIILVAVLGHKNNLSTESPDLNVQSTIFCVSWIQTTYQKIADRALTDVELSFFIDDSKSQLALREVISGKNSKFILRKLSSSKKVPYRTCRKFDIFKFFLAL